MKKAKWTITWYKNYRWVWIPDVVKHGLLWKDKWGSPRCEKPPTFIFEWLFFGIYCVKGTDEYWEQWLWVNEYCSGDVKIAKFTWEWTDFDTKESTWKSEWELKSDI